MGFEPPDPYPSSPAREWKKPQYLLTFLAGGDEKRLKAVSDWQVEASKESDKDEAEFSSWGIIKACKEIIFDVVDGVPIFHAIMYAFDMDRVSIKLEHTLNILVDGDQSQEEIEEDVVNTLALASASDVPVYPNSKEVAGKLASYHHSMLVNGFTAPDGLGNRVRLMLSKSPKGRIDDPMYISEVDVTEAYSPADIALIQEAVASEFSRLSHTRSLLDSLVMGISTFEKFLGAPKRNEHALQKCLAQYPILFGTEYVRVIPKHRLGSEYEMDYALQRASGIIDLVEIESSTLKLFTKSGNPSSHLIHAEQQVIDWLSWIERNHSYAEDNLPGLVSPTGFIIIGRSTELTQDNAAKLSRRNQLFRGQLQVLTYDDLLVRAKALLGRLEGISNDG